MEGYPLYYVVLFFLILSLIVADDQLSYKRSKAKESNPAYLVSSERGYGRDMYQPYYVCEPNDDASGMSLPAWHYSCKESCMSNHLKQQINITGAKWNYIGPTIDVYKVVTNEVCYTSHENMWGYCSQTQTSRPVKTLLSDKDALPRDIFDGSRLSHQGTYYITNSDHAECDYFSDETTCARDYQVMRRSGKINKRLSDSPPELTVLTDGIRTDPMVGSLQLDDVAWFWEVPTDKDLSDCGWEKLQKIVCSYTETTDVITCPSIGYTYNIQGVIAQDTCAGKIYDADGPFPFLYLDEKDYPASSETYKNARQGKADPDIAFIDGVNKAFTDLELTYCSATCDLFARQGSPEEDHVLDTPIGTWRYVQDNPLEPKLVPCLPTSTWKIHDPTTLCHGKDHVLVVDTVTGHPSSWNTEKDYIVTGELCNSNQLDTDDDLKDMRDKIEAGETINITFWTGDILQLAPPYDKPVWINGTTLFRQNPSWFSSVEISKDMLHTRDDISLLMTNMVASATAEVMYKKGSSQTFKKLFMDEVFGGIGNVTSSIWKGLNSLFGGFTKLVIIGVGLGGVYLVLVLLRALRSLLSSGTKKRVSFDIQDVVDDYKSNIRPHRGSTSQRKRTKIELGSLLA